MWPAATALRGTACAAATASGRFGRDPECCDLEREVNANSAGEVVAHFYEEFGAGNIDAALAACAEDLEVVDPGMGQVRGRNRFREYLETFKRAMPDARAIVEQVVESGETVAVEGRFTGTHTGPLASDEGDVEPTGAVVELRFADVSRVREGQIVAYHTYYDQLGLLTQLGLMGEGS